MKTRKLFAMALALVMALSLAVPAFAEGEETDTPSNQTVITAMYEDIEIAVKVPATVDATINPYGLPVTLDESDPDNTTISGQQITCAPATIENRSAVDLTVGAKTTTEVSGVTLATASTTGSETKPTAYVYLEVAGTTLAEGYDQSELYMAVANDETWTNSKKGQALKTGTSTSAVITDADLGTLTKGADGEAVSGSIAVFRLGGDCITAPKSTKWAEGNTITATITWTFTPAVAAAEDDDA